MPDPQRGRAAGERPRLRQQCKREAIGEKGDGEGRRGAKVQEEANDFDCVRFRFDRSRRRSNGRAHHHAGTRTEQPGDPRGAEERTTFEFVAQGWVEVQRC